MAHNLRSKARKDYARMHNGDSEEELKLQPEDDSITDDSDGEIESDKEEGEIEGGDESLRFGLAEDKWMNVSNEEFEAEVQEAKENLEVDRLEFLLNVRERRCQKLKDELNKSEKLNEKRLRVLQIEKKLKECAKMENSLSRSLENSRTSTPAPTPSRVGGGAVRKRSAGRKGSDGTRRKRVVATKGRALDMGGGRSPDTKKQKGRKAGVSPTQEGEENFLSSLVALKRGTNNEFSELLRQAMEAGENSNIIKNNRKMEKGGSSAWREFQKGNGHEALINSSEQKSVKAEAAIIDESIDSSHLIDVTSAEGKQTLVKLLEELKFTRFECECAGKSSRDSDVNNALENNDKSCQSVNGNKKLTSGRITKPDESDIKKQVKFAHEKLDSRHVKERIFDNLNFPLLIAGELELASLPDVSAAERDARIEIAKTMAYHKQYLNDDDLKRGYDTTLKTVEHGVAQWSRTMGEDLHRLYDYRANVLLREKLAGGEVKNKSGDKNGDKKEQDGSGDEASDLTKIIYCMDFNKGTCAFQKSHVGKWRGKKVTKWHVCRTCIKNSELKEHPEGDPKCSNKKA